VRTGEGLEEKFHERLCPAPFCRTLTITETGLTLGAGTVLARTTQGGRSHGAFDGEEERVLALLAVAFGKSVPVHVIGNLRRAAEQWSRGDKCLAHIHLAFASLPQIDEDGAARLALADEALAMGVTPRAVLKALGLDSAPLDALKFDPSQPRVPAGSGRESGRWTSDGNGSGSSDPLWTGRSISAGEERREDKPERELKRKGHSESRRRRRKSGTGIRSIQDRCLCHFWRRRRVPC
jgi:hypothetical protein